MFILAKNIVLDEGAFDTAVKEFSELAQQVRTLRNDIEGMLKNLESGFDTPAGHKFIQSCQSNLLEPIDKQQTAIEHISETLTKCRSEYKSVFDEYGELVQLINN